jgi:ionotropic kainate glutamate receptor 2
MLKTSNTTNTTRYEGFCIDLLNAISKELGFNYELYLVPDGRFGFENLTTGQWNGLVQELILKVIHLFL